MSDYLLDTNAAIARINGDVDIMRLLAAAQSVALPITAVGELFFGAENSGRVEANRTQVEGFIQGRTILLHDVETARWYERITHQQRAKGRSIPHNDAWIAAIALQHGLTLLTRDAHFNNIDSLATLGW